MTVRTTGDARRLPGCRVARHDDQRSTPAPTTSTEGGPAGYTESLSADCSGTLALGETKTCTVTNDDIAPKLTVIKHVINDNGGTKTAADFTLTATGAGTQRPCAGS